MFYSHEVLTSRKYGVATVWLVSSSNASPSQVNGQHQARRDARVQVDSEEGVTQGHSRCRCAQSMRHHRHPEAPLALRLQSNLLYGVTRVYAQQCGYVLHDVEIAKNNMQVLFNAVQANSLDTEGSNKARADQLVLQDDPNFLPDFDLVSTHLDQMDLNLTAEESQHPTLSPHDSQTRAISIDSQDLGGLIIPDSASSFVAGPIGGLDIFRIRESSAGVARTGPRAFLDDDLGLEIDQYGNLLMSDTPIRRLLHSKAAGERYVHSSVSSQPRLQDRPGLSNDENDHVDDDVFITLREDDVFATDDQALLAPVSGSAQHQITSEETAEAPQQRRARHVIRSVPVDNTMELRSSEMACLNANYVANMKEAVRQRDASKAAATARKNVEYWMMGREEHHPLNIFSGVKLLEALTGLKLSAIDRKHPRDENESTENRRRVRPRTKSPPHELARGEVDDGFLPMIGDDTIEQGRDAATPLYDRHLSSTMPWNQSTGSRRPTGLLTGAAPPTSTASVGGYVGPVGRRGSRLNSASPLTGRGNYGGSFDDIEVPASQGDVDMTGQVDFELFGPAAQVGTQTAGQSQWQRAILDGEGLHFLEFVQSGVAELDEARHQRIAGEEQDATLHGTIEFTTLLPPDSHTCIVAAQGLLHVLALCTKNLLSAQQDEAYGLITVRVIAAA